jgi:hypothetical protein
MPEQVIHTLPEASGVDRSDTRGIGAIGHADTLYSISRSGDGV